MTAPRRSCPAGRDVSTFSMQGDLVYAKSLYFLLFSGHTISGSERSVVLMAEQDIAKRLINLEEELTVDIRSFL